MPEWNRGEEEVGGKVGGLICLLALRWEKRMAWKR